MNTGHTPDSNPEGDGAARRYWPPFQLGDAESFATLARYVSVSSLDGFAFSDESLRTDSPEAMRAITRSLFEQLQSYQYHYRDEEAWVRRGWGGQWIRHLEWITTEGGNCVDYSTAFAAICVRACVAPALVVTPGHAFVLARAQTLLERSPELQLGGVSRSATGVYRVTDSAPLRAQIANGSLLPIDCVAVADPTCDFETAVERCTGYLESEVYLVDVPYLQALGEERFRALPAPTGWPAVRRHPQGPRSDLTATRLFAAQCEVAEAVVHQRGHTVAIVADAGKGKSTIGHHLVNAEPNGAGWFLAGADPQTLIDSLAEAELLHSGQRVAAFERSDREGYALAAVRRLENSPAPWIVVVDNADGDPKLLRKYLPQPRDGQLVVITSTNPEWLTQANVIPAPLGDVGDDEAAVQLQTQELSSAEAQRLGDLIAGRPLMVEAFSKLIVVGSVTPEAIAKHTPARDPESADLIGPVTYFNILSSLDSFGENQLRLCAIAAQLPPDQLPLDLLADLSGVDVESVTDLVNLGLFSHGPDDSRIRLHRLFGAAILWQFEADEHEASGSSLLENAALSIGASSGAASLLDAHADLNLVKALVARIAQGLPTLDRDSRGSDDRVKSALRNLGVALEARGDTRASADAFALVEPLLGNDETNLRIRGEIHHSRARVAFRYEKNDEDRLRQGLVDAKQAHAIALRASDEDNIGRYLAMVGLIMRALADYPGEGESSRALLADAKRVLEEAHALRDRRLDQTHPEWARSYYNLAGVYLVLAQAETERAAEHLQSAADVYETVWRLRRDDIYRCEVHAHIAPCIQGLGLVSYYRATLVSRDRNERGDQLRTATHLLAQALEQWEELEGVHDGTEAAKVSEYLAKVAIARNLNPKLSTKANPERETTPQIAAALAPLATTVINELGARHDIRPVK